MADKPKIMGSKEIRERSLDALLDHVRECAEDDVPENQEKVFLLRSFIEFSGGAAELDKLATAYLSDLAPEGK